MAKALSKEAILDFERIVRYPLSNFLESYSTFMSNHQRNILGYYAGKVEVVNQRSFDRLDELIKEQKYLDNLINHQRESLIRGDFWEVAELVDDIRTVLETTSNASKWLRSAITKNNFNPSSEVFHTLSKMQTLENVANNVVDSSNPDNDWVTIALRNDLIEEGYTSQGGNVLSVGSTRLLTIRLLSVVDNLIGERVYGKDIDRKITFNQDEEDLQTLSYSQTLIQAVEILSNLKKGDSPEYPEEGLQRELFAGSNMNSVAYPIIFRQLYSTFSQDDTLNTVTVTKIDLQTDSLLIDLFITTRIGEEQQTQIQL